MEDSYSRRDLLAKSAVMASAAPLVWTANHAVKAAEATRPDDMAEAPTFRYCLNTGTIRGQKLSLTQQIDVTARAGYDAIELWVGDLSRYVQSGGSLRDVRKQIADSGLTVESAIGFARWIVDDPQERRQGLEDAKRDMDLLAQIGGKRIAAPPAGANRQAGLDLWQAADRYRALLELGDHMGIVPQLENWGSSACLSRLAEVALVTVACGHARACLLPDVYHMYRGGSDFHGLKLISGQSIHVFHVNDYPDSPAREQLNDSHRVYPGDGVAPWSLILQTLKSNGFNGFLSLELFNREYWSQDASQVASTGLAKMRDVVAQSDRQLS